MTLSPTLPHLTLLSALCLGTATALAQTDTIPHLSKQGGIIEAGWWRRVDDSRLSIHRTRLRPR